MSRNFQSSDVLYFIDESVPDIESLLREVPATGELRVIGRDEDGIAQILAALVGKRDVSAIHLVSHGRPGTIVLGASVIDMTTLIARSGDFISVGRALAADADLLIYGCNVAEGKSGKAFLTKLSDLTGANVAASETLTGAADLGGDWNLEVRLGSVQASVLNVPSYTGVLPAPTITGFSPISYTEGGAAQSLGTVNFTNGSGYAGGSITFGVSGASGTDQLSLFSDSDPNATGAISVDDSGNVYLGNGGGRDLIGTVDTTENGQNGQPLTIHLVGNSTGALSNPSFEGSTSGWTIDNSRVILGTTVINGHVAPEDLTAPANSTNGAGGGIDNGDIQSMTYDNELATDQHTDGANSLRLFLDGQTVDGYDVVHGPSAYSETFAAQAGDVFAFDWRAAAGGDAFDAFGYLMNADTGEFVRVLDATGQNDTGETDWTSQSVTVPESGNWFFVFVAGTYDFTGGRVVGGSLYIDNFRVERSPVNDSVLGALAAHVQYENTSDTPPDAPRTMTVAVTDGAGDTETASTTIAITPVNDAPSGGVYIVGDPVPGAVLTATDDVVDPEGIVSSAYQWQRQLPDGTWTDITGASGASYTYTQDDIGRPVRAVLRYTDGDGVFDAVPSAPVNGNDGDDRFAGGSGNDQLLGGTGNDRLSGRDGRDNLLGEAGNDTISGGSDNDTIDGGTGNDQLFGNSGKDRIAGNSGRDKLFGQTGNDTLGGGADNDTLEGGSGHDRLFGGDGHDRLFGGSSNDRLYGGSGNDALRGDSGNDRIVGGLGRDKLWGGSGADVFDFNSIQESRAGSQRDVIYDFQSGQDRIDLRGIDANELRGGNQAFTWSCADVPFLYPSELFGSVLSADFTGQAGQLRYDGGILMGDTDGDRKADFEIRIGSYFSMGDVLL